MGMCPPSVDGVDIKEVAHNTPKFKHELKKFLLKNSFYSIEEYTNRDATYDTGDLQ